MRDLKRNREDAVSNYEAAPRPYPDCPLAVAYGPGVDSTAMLIEFVCRRIRPDLILFADIDRRPRVVAQARPSACLDVLKQGKREAHSGGVDSWNRLHGSQIHLGAVR